MSDVCPNCKAVALDTESERTCLNCGFVAVGASNLVQDRVTWVPSEKYSTGYGRDLPSKTYLNCHRFPKIAKGRTLGKKLITRAALRLGCTSRMTDETRALYDKVFDHGNFVRRRMKTKSVLAAACFYIVCRQFEWAVTLHDIADVAQCSVFELDRCKKEILEAIGIEIKSVDLESLTEARCEKANLDRGVMSSTKEVIELCQKLWISEGRNPENVICAASFVAWQGQEPTKRLKTSFRAFCKLCKFPFSRQANVLVGLIQDVLCELAKQIPWVGVDRVNPSQVALHLKDIVEFQNTLIADATADSSCEDESNSNPSDEDVGNEDKDVASSQLVSGIRPHLPSTSTSSLSHLRPAKNTTVKSGKRLSKNFTFLSKRSKVTHTEMSCKREDQMQPTTMNLDKEELGSEDIPDDDLHLFIKTNAEIDNEQSYLA